MGIFDRFFGSVLPKQDSEGEQATRPSWLFDLTCQLLEQPNQLPGARSVGVQRGIVDGQVEADGQWVMDEWREQVNELVERRATRFGRIDGRHHSRIKDVNVEMNPESARVGRRHPVESGS